MAGNQDVPGTGLARGLAMTAIVLGALSVVGVCFGSFALVSQQLLRDTLVATQPPFAQDAYRDVLDVQASLWPLSVLQLAVVLGVSAFMIFAGAQAWRGKGWGPLKAACLAAVACDIVVAITPMLTWAWTYKALAAYIETLGDVPGAQGGAIGGVVGAAASLTLYLALAGFWLWAYTQVNAVHRATSDA
jgi:hypothetical protein